MTDEDALLAAIAAAPAEDTPRLAYADWLDEHDRPVRAEFIRLQVDIARKQDALTRAELDRHVALFERQQELLDHHRAEQLGPLAGLPAEVKVEFDRGFVSELTFDADHFVAHADAISALKPLPGIRLQGAGARLDELSDVSHHLELVSALEMQTPRAAEPVALEPSEVWSIFVECWPWDRLKELSLEGCQIGDDGLRRLGASESLGLLGDLDLSNNDVTDAGVVHLLDSPFPRQLRRLILGGNPIGDQGAIELADRWPKGAADKLEYLNLRFTNIGTPGRQALLARFGGRIDLF
jgi:uncharacterized protein (TIGR02996 family)